MQIKLVEQLQKLFEEDLFPEASEEELKNRAEEQAIKFLKRLNGLKTGDKVRVKRHSTNALLHTSVFAKPINLQGCEGVISHITNDSHFENTPIKITFTNS